MEVNIADVVLCEFYFSDTRASKKRPVLVFKDNLPYDDFIGIAISSRTHQIYEDEFILDNTAFLTGEIPKISKLMLRKTFVVSKTVIIKKYGRLTDEVFTHLSHEFCRYFNCQVASVATTKS